MTDNEIINLLDRCKHNHSPATYTYSAIQEALDLINRQVDYIHEQQKVIDGLKENYNKKGLTVEVKCDKEQLEKIVQDCVKSYELQINEIRNEAIKEFAERLKMECYATYDEVLPSLFADIIDKLVKEMAEGNENDRA